MNRLAFIEQIMLDLKINKSPFSVSLIREYLEPICDTELKEFYKALFGTQHSYLNAMDRIAKTAEQFAPVKVDRTTRKAKELIAWIETLNTHIGLDAKRTGEDFVKLVNRISLKDMGANDDLIAVLDEVKPHYGHKRLIIEIRHYQTSLDTINAFKSAIEKMRNKTGKNAIASGRVQKMIRGSK